MSYKLIAAAVWLLVALTACGRPTVQTQSPASVEEEAAPSNLVVEVTYPSANHIVEKGQQIKFTLDVHDSEGNEVRDAEVQLTVLDDTGKPLATLPATQARGSSVYRSDYWRLPADAAPGEWQVETQVTLQNVAAQGEGRFQVEDGMSDIFLAKYGVWIDPPTMGNITPSVMDERGDAANGMFTWGGSKPGMHILQTNWLEVAWRTGDFQLTSPEAVEQFLLGELGDIGYSPIRALGPIEPFRFKEWEGWKVRARSRQGQELVEWVVFYAPEVDKTFGIGTTAQIPPPDIDPHATLRDSFAVHPEIDATGKAPKPIRDLDAAPRQLAPDMGARFVGPEETIGLAWEPVESLAEDEYYEVIVDYNYGESNIKETFITRETQLTVPQELYHAPNCHVFNWQVTLKRDTGQTYSDGTRIGEALSFPSLYPFFIWDYPADEQEPFTMYCPNEQM